MTLKIDKEKCIGCGTCPIMAPNTFKMNDTDYKAEIINPTGDDPDTIKATMEACPTLAIIIEE